MVYQILVVRYMYMNMKKNNMNFKQEWEHPCLTNKNVRKANSNQMRSLKHIIKWSGALPGFILDLGLLKIIWCGIFSYF